MGHWCIDGHYGGAQWIGTGIRRSAEGYDRSYDCITVGTMDASRVLRLK